MEGIKNSHINYDFLRKKKAKVLEYWHETAAPKTNNIQIWTGTGYILPARKDSEIPFGRGGVVDQNRIFIDTSSIANRFGGPYDFTNVEYIDKKVVYCGYLVNHWGHFLIEAVARLWYVLEHDQTVDQYIFVIEENGSREIKGNYKEFFQLLGIWDKISLVNKPTQYREIIVPELGYRWRRAYSEKYLSIFSTIAKNAKTDPSWVPYDKIFLTRSQLKGIEKHEFGNDMLDSFFSRNGYAVIAPEKISLSHLIYLLHNAKICATVSGSLPHNMLFAPDGISLQIVERNVLNNEIQADINCMKALNVTYIDANIPIYSVNLAYGPFILAYEGHLERFADIHGYKKPGKEYIGNKVLKQRLQKYIKEYKRVYHYQWFMDEWTEPYCDYLREGYRDGFMFFGEYLNGQKPLYWYQWFQLNYLKQAVKRILNRISRRSRH